MEEDTGLKFNTFNHGRELDARVVNEIVAAIVEGECKSAINPILVAIDTTEAAVTSRDSTEQVKGPSSGTFYIPGTRVEVLAGFHRVMAARKAVHILEENLKRLRRHIGDAQEDFDDDDFDPADVKTGENMLDDLENKVLAIESLIERIKMWPAKLYSIGMSLIRSKP